MKTAKKQPPVVVEDQLAASRAILGKMTKLEWAEVALAAKTTERTLYNIVDVHRKPGYDTVHRVLSALRAHEQRLAKQ